MNGNKALLEKLCKKLNSQNFRKVDVLIAPPYTLLAQARMHLNLGYGVCAQNIYSVAESGAYTGAVGVEQVKDTGARAVLVGHSERRKYFGETFEQLLQQTETALKASLSVIFCVGETDTERDKGETLNVLRKEVEGLIEYLKEKRLEDMGVQVILAYEPVWAIGTGKAASIEDISQAIEQIKNVCNGTIIKKVLYGGSITGKNVEEILQGVSSLDGFLVGKASLSEEFVDICKACTK